MMANWESEPITDYDSGPGSCNLSIILSTQNDVLPKYLHPERIKSMIPKQFSNEIIVVHYNQTNITSSDHFDAGSKVNYKIKTGIPQIGTEKQGETLHLRAKDKLTYAVMKGVGLSVGQIILIIDADFPYPDELILKLTNQLINSPDSIIIASKYAEGASMQRLPIIRNMISKGAKVIARHGLKVKHVQDPLSGCFAISRQLLKSIKIEGKGDEILLEILVKLNRNKKYNNITVIEIPFIQEGEQATKKLDLNRILSYSKAVWHLYRYGEKSKLKVKRENPGHNTRSSVLFLSKAGRFFTVGASGLVVNYVASFLISNLVPNIWYIHATLFGIILSITSNFLLNKIWTFEDRDFSPIHFLRQYVLFVVLCTLGAIIQLSLVYVFVEYSHIPYAVSLIMAVCIASLSNFLLNKKITFGEKIWE